ncbi:porin [Paraburkholderia graminis]|uniref:porin n=1 Tax=Paraburkholderia graminis TaxID=60548 RepID=UPI0038BA3096
MIRSTEYTNEFNCRKINACRIARSLIKLLCISILGHYYAANAQSTVILYGILDGSILYTSKTLNSTTHSDAGHQISMSSSGLNSSVFGFRGTEDLGQGLRAIFDLESGYNISNGVLASSNGNFFGRQAWVGIAGNFGTVKVGLQYSPFFLRVVQFDARESSMFGSSLLVYLNNVLVTGCFNSNAISYTSPEIAGFQASGLLAMGGTAGNFSAGKQESASLIYHLGGLTLGAALYQGNPGGSAASTPVPSTLQFDGRMLGAAYRLDYLTVTASYVLYKVAQSFSNQVYSTGVDYKISPFLEWNAGIWYTRDGNNSTNHSILGATGLNYFLSKATTVYAQVGVVKNHGALNTGLANINAFYGVSGTTFGANFGIRHMF